MKKIKQVPSLVLVILLLAGAGASQGPTQNEAVAASNATKVAPPARITDLRPTVILISLDGFRWDYPDKYAAPNLQELIRGGVRAEMVPSFPTKTFPNHYTLVTGLYPGNHGIVANNMWDDEMKAGFKMSDRAAVTDPKWWGGEPLWVTARKQGQKTSAMFWPGSEAPIQGVYPDYWQTYVDEMPYAERVAWVLAQLDRQAAERPTFNTLYFSAVDNAGHQFGPDSPEVAAAVKRVDASVGELMQGLKARGIYDRVNLIVVADHGMIPIAKERQIFLDDFIDVSQMFVVDWSPVLAIRAKDGNNEALYQKLRKTPHMKVYRKAELPARYHYSKSSRVMPVIGVVDAGWTLTTRKRAAEREWGSAGNHGFDPALRDMHAVFIAHGPNFKAGARLKPFENVHVYPAMMKILGLRPAAGDGDVRVLEKVMQSPVLEMETDEAAAALSGRPYCAKEDVPLNLTLLTDAQVTGSIEDQTGAPFAGAPVEVRVIRSVGAQSIARVASDSKGHFRLPKLKKGAYRLVASSTRAFAQPEGLECRREDCELEIRLKVNPNHLPLPFSYCPVQ